MSQKLIYCILLLNSLACLRAEVTLEQRAAFLGLLKRAISENQPSLLYPVLCVKDLDDVLVVENKSSINHLINTLAGFSREGSGNDIDYKWEDPPAGGRSAMEEVFKGFRYQPNMEPAIIVTFTSKGLSSQLAPKLTLGIENDRLWIIGTSRIPTK